MSDSQTVVICEGFHDRALWAGWLLHCGWTGPKTPAERRAMQDLHGRGGEGSFIYTRATSGRCDYCRVIPALSDSAVLDRASTVLANGKRTDRLIVSWDSDELVGHESPAMARTRSFGDWCRAHAVELGSTQTANAVWWVPNAQPTPGLPGAHTLELVVCNALCAVVPSRAIAVHAFLDAAPVGPSSTPKHFAWSYMAKWFGEAGCDEFYQAVWSDPAVAAALTNTLGASGALAAMTF